MVTVEIPNRQYFLLFLRAHTSLFLRWLFWGGGGWFFVVGLGGLALDSLQKGTKGKEKEK